MGMLWNYYDTCECVSVCVSVCVKEIDIGGNVLDVIVKQQLRL